MYNMVKYRGILCENFNFIDPCVFELRRPFYAKIINVINVIRKNDR